MREDKRGKQRGICSGMMIIANSFCFHFWKEGELGKQNKELERGIFPSFTANKGSTDRKLFETEKTILLDVIALLNLGTTFPLTVIFLPSMVWNAYFWLSYQFSHGGSLASWNLRRWDTTTDGRIETGRKLTDGQNSFCSIMLTWKRSFDLSSPPKYEQMSGKMCLPLGKRRWKYFRDVRGPKLDVKFLLKLGLLCARIEYMLKRLRSHSFRGILRFQPDFEISEETTTTLHDSTFSLLARELKFAVSTQDFGRLKCGKSSLSACA